MPRVGDLDLPRGERPSADQRGEMARQGALAEQAAGAPDQLIERQIERHQGAEGGVQVRHQHRGRDTLAGHVAEDEVDAAVPRVQDVAVVAADRSRPFVVAGHLVAREAQRGRRQEPLQNSGRQIEIVLEGMLLRRRQMVETVPEQRIPDQALRLDRLVALLAQTEALLVHALQGRIDFAQEPPDPLVAGDDRLGALQLLAPLLQLFAQQCFDRGRHHPPPGYFCFFAFCRGAREPEKV